MFAQKQESGQIIVFLVNTGAQKIPGNCKIDPFQWSNFLKCPKNKESEEVIFKVVRRIAVLY